MYMIELLQLFQEYYNYSSFVNSTNAVHILTNASYKRKMEKIKN